MKLEETLESMVSAKVKSSQLSFVKKNRSIDYELDELREHVDNISFNISKVYRHAEKRSRKKMRKEMNKNRNNLKEKYSFKYRKKEDDLFIEI